MARRVLINYSNFVEDMTHELIGAMAAGMGMPLDQLYQITEDESEMELKSEYAELYTNVEQQVKITIDKNTVDVNFVGIDDRHDSVSSKVDDGDDIREGV